MAARALRTTRAKSVAYRRIVVPLGDEDESELGVALAAELAPEAGAAITAVVVIEVPAELPLEAHMLDEEGLARRALEKADAIAASRGVRLRSRIVRARARGEAIVAEADATGADLIVVRASRHPGTALFGRTVDYVLRRASCRVLVMRP
jgi:nucleotide-binding universal stress UspA family protein